VQVAPETCILNSEDRKMLKETMARQRTTPITASSLFAFFGILILAGCARAGTPAAHPTTGALFVSIHTVQVTQQSEIFISGATNLPDGACVKTELLADDAALVWWPRDFCAQVEDGEWGLLIPAVLHGTPIRIEPGRQYLMHAWWPENQAETLTSFPFDLDGPPSPDR
jgi:hypothetical protein